MKSLAFERRKSRQRPTLPHGFPCSTIGSEELNFRVRDGIGCGLFDVATGNLGSSPSGIRNWGVPRRIFVTLALFASDSQPESWARAHCSSARRAIEL